MVAVGPVLREAWGGELVGKMSGSIVPGVVEDWRRGRKNAILSWFGLEFLIYTTERTETDTNVSRQCRAILI